ncbi:MAG TPA: gliding motility-associated protein GldE [Taishania sp.]|nr:gliding motility-associated protein GldE [Taishania sp.]
MDPSPEPLATTFFNTFSLLDVVLIVLNFILLGASALFAGAEVAFFSISQLEKDQLKKNESRGAKLAQKLLEKPKELLATILVGKNFLNVAFVILTSILLLKLFLNFQVNWWLINVINVVLITLFLVFVGESFPKTVAFRNKAAYVRWMSPYIYCFQIIPPFSWLKKPLAKSSSILERRAKRKGIKISQDALETVLTLSQNASDSENDYTMLQGVLKFGNTDVKQVMCPRMDVVGVEEKFTLDEVMKTFVDVGYSRLPVFRESFDEVIGIIFVKDLIPFLASGKHVNWLELIREPFFVPENKKIDDLLKEFQAKKVHIAIVIDEYGGSTGLVTMEDVLEEIVGDITDEYDEEEKFYDQINDSTFLFEGWAHLDDFCKITGVEESFLGEQFDDVETLGGLIAQIAGRIPKTGESIDFGPFKFVVDQSDKKRVKKVKVIIPARQQV